MHDICVVNDPDTCTESLIIMVIYYRTAYRHNLYRISSSLPRLQTLKETAPHLNNFLGANVALHYLNLWVRQPELLMSTIDNSEGLEDHDLNNIDAGYGGCSPDIQGSPFMHDEVNNGEDNFGDLYNHEFMEENIRQVRQRTEQPCGTQEGICQGTVTNMIVPMPDISELRSGLPGMDGGKFYNLSTKDFNVPEEQRLAVLEVGRLHK